MSIALVGLPNCGKTSLFNALTGSRQKVANYPGVTVERKEGWIRSEGAPLRVLDLPGTYSLDSRTPDEEITREVILGRFVGEARPEVVVAVLDATNLERNLALVLELKALQVPMVIALNMMDLASRRGLALDQKKLEAELGIRVFPTVAVRSQGLDPLIQSVRSLMNAGVKTQAQNWESSTGSEVRARFNEVDRILRVCVTQASRPSERTRSLDRIVLHPIWGVVVLGVTLALMFQAIFSWASVPADWIELGVAAFGKWVGTLLSDGPLRSLIVDGMIAGVGAVLVFLPQILILFAFIYALEDSGYLARAAFLMDRIMSKVGLQGRALIPLLSSYACAIPGIMATRTIASPRDRLATILVTPLTTCSARLPVYTLLVGAFIPAHKVWGWLGLQGLVLLGLYVMGTVAPLTAAWALRRTVLRGPKPMLLMELPTYKRPSLKGLALGLFERTQLFLKRAGTIILALSVVIWFLSTYPQASDGSASIESSYAAQIGKAIEPVLRPLGFDWRVGMALVPGFAAREVMVSALGTVYAVEASDEGGVAQLGEKLASSWSLATALSLIVWYVFAPQCISTLAVVRRETNSWRWTGFLLLYLTVLAYLASWVTFQTLSWLGWGH
jgi:ferrous iron transport protein B